MVTRSSFVPFGIALILMFGSILFMPQSSADTPKNDLVSQAERIGTGIHNGVVLDYYSGEYPNTTYHEDDDYYSVMVPGWQALKVFFFIVDDNTDIVCESIVPDEDGYSSSNRIDINLYYGSQRYNKWYNQYPREREIFLHIYGNGSYEFKTWFEKVPVEDRKDSKFEWLGAKKVKEGSFTGAVNEGSLIVPSAAYFVMTIDNGSVGKVSLKKIGSGMETLKATIYERETISSDSWPSLYSDRIDVFLTDENRSMVYDPFEEIDHFWFEDEHVATGDVDIYVMVSGTGNYSVTFEQWEVDTTGEEEEEDIDVEGAGTAFVIIAIIALAMVMLPIILIVVIVITIVIFMRKRTGEKKDLPPSLQKKEKPKK